MWKARAATDGAPRARVQSYEMMIPLPTRATLAASPTAFLVAISFINWLGFAGWQALFNNFAKEAAGFTGWEVGILQSVREIPGFLASRP